MTPQYVASLTVISAAVLFSSACAYGEQRFLTELPCRLDLTVSTFLVVCFRISYGLQHKSFWYQRRDGTEAFNTV